MSGSRLQDNFVILSQKLDVEKVIPYLREERMLTADEHEQLSLPMFSVQNKRERLLLLLPRKGRRHFESFGNCLVWSGQVDLAKAIGIDVDSVPPSPYGPRTYSLGVLCRLHNHFAVWTNQFCSDTYNKYRLHTHTLYQKTGISIDLLQRNIRVDVMFGRSEIYPDSLVPRPSHPSVCCLLY